MTRTAQFSADYLVFATGTTADTDFSVTHDLGRTPVELFVLSRSEATRVYRGSVAWSSTAISLRANVVGVLIGALLV